MLTGTLATALAAFCIGQTPLPVGTPAYAVPVDSGHVDVALAETGLLRFASSHSIRPNAFFPTGGVIVAHAPWDDRVVLLDDDVGVMVADERGVRGPVIPVYGGRGLSATRDPDEFLVVCEKSVIRVRLRPERSDVVYTLPVASAGIEAPLVGAADGAHGVVVASAEGQLACVSVRVDKHRLQAKVLSRTNVGAAIRALAPLSATTGVLATDKGLLGYRVESSGQQLATVRLTNAPARRLQHSSHALFWATDGGWFVADRERVTQAIRSGVALSNVQPLADVAASDSLVLHGRLAATWNDSGQVHLWNATALGLEPTGRLTLISHPSHVVFVPAGIVCAAGREVWFTSRSSIRRHQCEGQVIALLSDGTSVWVVHKGGIERWSAMDGETAVKRSWQGSRPTAAVLAGRHVLVAVDGKLKWLDGASLQSVHEATPPGRLLGLVPAKEFAGALLDGANSGQAGWRLAVYTGDGPDVQTILDLSELKLHTLNAGLPRRLGLWAGRWWLLDGAGTLWLRDGGGRWERVDGGVRDAAPFSDGELLLAKARYGVRALRLRNDVPALAAGWSQMWLGPVQLSCDGNTIWAYQPGYVWRVVLHRGKPKTVFEVPELAKIRGPIRVLDGDVDVTSVRYAVDRGYAEPLRLIEGDAERTEHVAPGTVLVDRKRGVVRFSDGISGSVQEVGFCYLPHPGNCFAIYRDRYLVVGGGEGRNLECWDISQPKRPKHLWRIQPAVGPPVALATEGDRLFVAANIWGTGLYVYDLSDLTTPCRLGQCTELGERISSMVLRGKHAFVLSYRPDPAVIAVDVSDPKSLRVIRRLRIGGASIMAGSESFLCVVAGKGATSRLVLVDARQPRAMSISDEEPLGFDPHWVAAEGELIAVSGSERVDNKRFGVVAVFRREGGMLRPLYRWRENPPGWLVRTVVALAEDALYVGYMSPSLTVLRTYRVSSAKPTAVSEYTVGPGLDGACEVGHMLPHRDRLFVAVPQTAVRVFDITDRLRPRLAFRVPAAEGWGGHVEVANGGGVSRRRGRTTFCYHGDRCVQATATVARGAHHSKRHPQTLPSTGIGEQAVGAEQRWAAGRTEAAGSVSAQTGRPAQPRGIGARRRSWHRAV